MSEKMTYKVLKQEGRAKRAVMETVHGTIQTPVFMNVGTVAAIKGAVSTEDLEGLGTQVELSNTYHLHVRPGDEKIKAMGGLHRFMSWNKPILTDSGGFQVFSLAGLRKIKEEGVTFRCHIDGHKIFMGPEESMRIQSNLASTIAMAFDECAPAKAERSYVQPSVDRTTRWLERCKKEMHRLNQLEDTVNPKQMLFGINQGATYEDLRVWHMQQIAKIDCDGFAIGGLAVGEPTEVMYQIIEAVEPYMPKDKPRYLMGVGTPQNLLEGIARGVDMFDCVMPTRNGRNAMLFSYEGTMNMRNKKWEADFSPLDPTGCEIDRITSKAYLHHLFKAGELLAMQIASIHNLAFYLRLVTDARAHILQGDFTQWKSSVIDQLGRRI